MIAFLKKTSLRLLCPWQGPTLVAATILLSAAATRLCFLWASPDRAWPHAVLYEGDGPLYARFAQALRDAQPFELGLPIHSPGLAYVMALYPLSQSGGFLAAKIGMAILGAMNCLLVWSLGRRLLSERVAALGGLLAACSFGLIVQGASINNETPYTFLLLCVILLTLRIKEPRRAGRAARPANFTSTEIIFPAVILGALHGAAALLRAEHALLVPLFVLYQFYRSRGKSVVATVAAPAGIGRRRTVTICVIQCAVFFIVCLPWNYTAYKAIESFNHEARPTHYDAVSVRWSDDARAEIESLPVFARQGCVMQLSEYARASGLHEVTRKTVKKWFTEVIEYTPQPLNPFVFISNQGALSFALANNAESDGGFSTTLLDAVRGVPAREGHVSAADFSFGDPRHLQLFQNGYFIGLRYLALHPTGACSLLAKKLAIFASGLGSGLSLWNLPLGMDGIRRPVDQFTSKPGEGRWWTAVLLLFAMIGIAQSLRRRIGGLLLIAILYKLAITLAFYGYSRQAVSMLPIWYLFVALGVDTAIVRPASKLLPNVMKHGRSSFAAVVAIVIVSSLWAGSRGWAYDVEGMADPAPQWGYGAFESSQQLQMKRIASPTPASSNR